MKYYTEYLGILPKFEAFIRFNKEVYLTFRNWKKNHYSKKLFLCIVFSRTKPCIRRRGAKVNNRKSLEKWRTHWCPPSSFQILSFSTLSHFWTDFLSSGHPLSVRYLCLFSFNSHNCKNIQSVPSPLFFKRMLAFFVLVKNKSVWGSLGYVILLTFFYQSTAMVQSGEWWSPVAKPRASENTETRPSPRGQTQLEGRVQTTRLSYPIIPCSGCDWTWR